VLYSPRVSSRWSLTRNEEGTVYLRVMDTQMDTKVGGPVLGDVETQRMTSPTNRERFTFTLWIGQCCHPGQPGRRGVRPGDRVGETRGPSDRVKRPRLESGRQ
jgi:hypothetical protein